MIMGNKIIKRLIVLCSLLLVITTGSMAQQQIYSYSQYADNLIAINPAYSLLDKAGSVSLMGRKQFIGIDGAPNSLMLSSSFPIESIGGAAGVYVLSDQIAIEKQVEANAYFAKGIQLTGTTFLSVSLNAGVRNYTAAYSTLDPSDPTFRDDVRETKPNIGFGVMLYSEKYYLGVSVPELSFRNLGNASTLQSNYLRTHYYFSGAYLATLSEDVKLKPSTLVSYVNGSPVVADFTGTIYLKDQLGLGVNYRTNKKAAGIISVNTNAFKVGYSYQFGISSSNLGGFNNAVHEVSLSYRFGKISEPKLL